MQTVYFLGGLVTDKRTFSFLDLSFCSPVFVEWLPPLVEETLPAYALRLKAKIPDDSIIVGLSFGGMLAVEMAKKGRNLKVILLSSAAKDSQLAAWIKALQYLPAYKLLTDKIIHHSAAMVIKLCGITGKAQQQLQHKITADTNGAFTRWAIGAIANWHNAEVPPNIVHIHGTDDKLVPYLNVQARYTITHGEHLMVMDHPEIAGMIAEIIKNY